MAVITIKIETGNAAFQDGPEISAILQRITDKVRDNSCIEPGFIFDTNGNRVGGIYIN